MLIFMVILNRHGFADWKMTGNVQKKAIKVNCENSLTKNE